MTIEQAKSELMQIYGALSPDKQRAIDTLVKIEPCEDAISRDELLKAMDTWDKFGVDDTNSLFRLDNLSLPYYVPYIHYDDVIKCIKGMPPVNPQEPKYCDRNICVSNEYNGIGCDECEVTKSQEPKTGHWMHDGSHWKNRFIRSECGYKLFDEQTNYCPNCGCAMVEPQESEDK